MNKLKDYRSLFLSPVHAAYRTLAREVESRVGEFDSADGHMLSYVTRYGPCTVGTLAEVFGIKGATLTGQLDRLERAGWLERRINPDDRRSFVVAITPKGRGLVRRIGRQVMQLEGAVREQVSERDYKGFIKVIEAIRELDAVEKSK